MTRWTPLLVATLLLAACGKEEPAAPAAPAMAPTTQATPADPAPPPPQAVGESCKKDCGGQVVSIQCAAGETPVCECGTPATALCRAPAQGGQ